MGKGPYKVSMLGDWRSGRSSVVAALSGKPCPNHPGIQVTCWRPQDGPLLEVWDVNSRSALESLGQTFLAHADALVAVADASRPASLTAAEHALRAAFSILGPRPACLLWNLSRAEPAAPRPELPDGVTLHRVRAIEGEGVVEAFEALAARLAAAPAGA